MAETLKNLGKQRILLFLFAIIATGTVPYGGH